MKRVPLTPVAVIAASGLCLFGCPKDPPPRAAPASLAMGSRPTPPGAGDLEGHLAATFTYAQNDLSSDYYRTEGGLNGEGALRLGLSDNLGIELGGNAGSFSYDGFLTGDLALRYRFLDTDTLDLVVVGGASAGASARKAGGSWGALHPVGAPHVAVELDYELADWSSLYAGSRYQFGFGTAVAPTHFGLHTLGIELRFWRMFVAFEASLLHYHTHAFGSAPAYGTVGGTAGVGLGIR